DRQSDGVPSLKVGIGLEQYPREPEGDAMWAPVRLILIWTGLAILSASALAEPASDRDHRGNPRRYPLTTGTSEGLPPQLPLVVIRSPNWQDRRIYPRAALRYNQQGIVGVEVLIDASGVPSGCRIALSSGYVELDDGTCDLWLMVRFQPPHN